jgi:hypothetical protein
MKLRMKLHAEYRLKNEKLFYIKCKQLILNDIILKSSFARDDILQFYKENVRLRLKITTEL